MRYLVVAAVLLAACNADADCRPTTDALESMDTVELILKGPEKRNLALPVRLADDDRTRAAGFQHICPESIADTAIYFVFDSPRRPTFHMRNVKAPLDIAFIDERGMIIDIQRMKPYVLGASRHEYYSPQTEVAAAIETRAGYFSEQRISAGQWKVGAGKQ